MSLKNQYEEFLKRYGGNIVNTNFGNTPVVTTEFPVKQTTPSSTPSVNPVVNPSSNTTPSTTPSVSPSVNPTPSINANSTNLWDLYSKQLAQSNINQKAELAAINEKANQYTNAYLKSLGLQGTNAGATQIAQNNANLMNAYREIDANQQAALRQYEDENKSTNEDRIYEVYETALSNPNISREQLDEIMTNFDPNMTTQDYLNYLANISGVFNEEDTWKKYRDNAIELITRERTNKLLQEPKYQEKADKIIQELQNANTKTQIEEIFNKYKIKLKNVQ